MPEKSEKKTYHYETAAFTYEGKRYYPKGKTKAEAERKKEEMLEALKRNQTDVDGNMTVRQWAEVWLENYKAPKVRAPGTAKKRGTMTQKSFNMYRQKIDQYIVPAIGNMKLTKVQDIHLVKILNSQKGKSKSQCSKIRMILKAMFSQAYASHLIPYDPSVKLELPEVSEGGHRSITEYEREVLYQVAEKHRCGLWVIFMLRTGLRPAETAPLEVRDLNYNKKTISVTKAIESGTEDVVGPPKSKASIRTVPILDDLLLELKAQVAGKAPTDFVFPQTDGVSMKTSTCIMNDWRSFTRQMDLLMGAETTPHGHIYDPKDLNHDGTPRYPDPDDPSKPRNGHKIADDLQLYCLRHTFCTDMKKAGVPVEIAKTLMGHEDITTTTNIYMHADESDTISAADLMNAYLLKKK